VNFEFFGRRCSELIEHRLGQFFAVVFWWNPDRIAYPITKVLQFLAWGVWLREAEKLFDRLNPGFDLGSRLNGTRRLNFFEHWFFGNWLQHD